MNIYPWKVSLHGGHSNDYCDHAYSPLREIIEAAIHAGYHTFGISEHAPRNGEHLLYSNERQLGWTLEKIQADFARYTEALPALIAEFADRITLLGGFEVEVVPDADYIRWMRGYRAQKRPDGSPAFDYMVGSVHYLQETSIDGSPEKFQQLVEGYGGLVELGVHYYAKLTEMMEALKPEVVGHLDLVKLNAMRLGHDDAWLTEPRMQAAVEETLEAVRANQAILDLNTAGWRKGLPEPYPGPWLVQRAHAMGIPFCFGDDSHQVSQVGDGILQARDYLLANGVPSVTILTREDGEVIRRTVPLA